MRPVFIPMITVRPWETVDAEYPAVLKAGYLAWARSAPAARSSAVHAAAVRFLAAPAAAADHFWASRLAAAVPFLAAHAQSADHFAVFPLLWAVQNAEAPFVAAVVEPVDHCAEYPAQPVVRIGANRLAPFPAECKRDVARPAGHRSAQLQPVVRLHPFYAARPGRRCLIERRTAFH